MEELLISGEQLATSNSKIFKSMEKFPPPEKMLLLLNELQDSIANNSHQEIIKIFQNNVEGYK